MVWWFASRYISVVARYTLAFIMTPTTGVRPLMQHGQLLTPWRLLDLAPVDPLLWHLARLRARQDVATCLVPHRMLEFEVGACCHNAGATEV